ncbi:MAG: caspase family protein [Candidatus Sumerlaeota bacterium]|nr:caspase family protein [Candidatus Sumerlaeota bacterium]
MKRRRAILCLLFVFALAFGGAAHAERYALLVGVNEYIHNPQWTLEGCTNDARLMAELLIERFAFAKDNVHLLLDRQATADGIRQAFRTVLIQGTKAGDTAVFYFSGHGSQIPDTNGDEADQLDEFIVPSDCQRTEAKGFENCVIDDELGQWAAEMAGREFVAIFDCCHSGTGLRGLEFVADPKVHARYIPMIEPGAGTRGIDDPVQPTPLGEVWYRDFRGAEDQGAATLIAACQPDERAREMPFEIKGKTEEHGALTVKLVKALSGETLDPTKPATYRDIKSLLEQPIVIEGNRQLPSVESAEPLLDKPLLRAFDAAPAPVKPYDSGVQIPQQTETVGQLRVRLVSLGELEGRQDGKDEPTESALKAQLGAQPFLTLTDPAKPECDAVVFYQKGAPATVGTAIPGGPVTTRMTVPQLDAAGLKPLVDELKRIYAVQNLQRMENPQSPYKVAVRLGSGGTRLRLGEKVQFIVRSEKAGYLSLVNIDCQGGLHVLFPNQYAADGQIEAQKDIVLPQPDKYDLQVMKPTGREFVKAIVSAKPLKMESLSKGVEAGGMRSIDAPADMTDMVNNLARAIGVVKSEKTLPAAGALEVFTKDEWGAASLRFDTTD